MPKRRIGFWILGAKGAVAATTIVGLAALKKKLTEPVGLATEMDEMSHLDLVDFSEIVIGGHEIRKASLWDEVQLLHTESKVFDASVLNRIKSDIQKTDERIRPGIITNVGNTIEGMADRTIRSKQQSPREALNRVQKDLKKFQSENRLDRVILLNLTSTEPPVDTNAIPASWDKLEPLIDKPGSFPLAASSIYAIAAFQLKMPYINFTPSLGSSCSALEELAIRNEVCHMGRDGKTGETLMKSVLAPMFAHRNLNVMSWVGHNIFGNRDGEVLDDPVNKQTKVVSKDQLLGQILGYDPQTLVTIEYIKSLGDWKTAWDHIHFQGFLGTPMTLQFTWQGCDSLLAAPLAIDLFRLTELAARQGETGLLKHLSCFFKSPTGVDENGFVRQFQMLQEWVGQAE